MPRPAPFHRLHPTLPAFLAALLLGLALGSPLAHAGGDDDPPEVTIGERLFLETRFAQYFFAHGGGHVNAPLKRGDPVMDTADTSGVPELGRLAGPFAGQSMNCRACHLVDELAGPKTFGIRTYADFAVRSPVSRRPDGELHTPRNSPALVNALIAHPGPTFLHDDGEFTTPEDLVKGTLTGRNMGWLPTEAAAATANVATVIRQDDGTGALAKDYAALPYRVLLAGTSDKIPAKFRLPPEYRLDVRKASDGAVLDAVARLITAYLRSLAYARNDQGAYTGSPYDKFILANGLPTGPDAQKGETAVGYGQRLLDAVNALPHPKFIGPADGKFTHHDQAFAFGPQELAGLKTFLAQPAAVTYGASAAEAARGGIGNCAACHAPPDFTDFGFHNTGTAQADYDAVNGGGKFVALKVPGLAARNAARAQYLPATADNPRGRGPFRSIPAAGHPGLADLGLWNMFANASYPAPNAPAQHLRDLVCAAADFEPCAPHGDAELLPYTVGLFRTPTLRDLGQSAPYFHTGRARTLEDAITHYVTFSALARAGSVRNRDPRLAGIALLPDGPGHTDVADLAAFLRSLNEDYE